MDPDGEGAGIVRPAALRVGGIDDDRLALSLYPYAIDVLRVEGDRRAVELAHALVVNAQLLPRLAVLAAAPLRVAPDRVDAVPVIAPVGDDAARLERVPLALLEDDPAGHLDRLVVGNGERIDHAACARRRAHLAPHGAVGPKEFLALYRRAQESPVACDDSRSIDECAARAIAAFVDENQRIAVLLDAGAGAFATGRTVRVAGVVAGEIGCLRKGAGAERKREEKKPCHRNLPLRLRPRISIGRPLGNVCQN